MKGQIEAILAEARQKKETAHQFFADLTEILAETDKTSFPTAVSLPAS
ncbi:MAG: hypothetical protein SCK29_14255 [Bacillota bacterium]|nr:hypothetical protein [Bacillota bacterium]MDW7685264.1 hypothetical protein [Bacillota bacterium]